MCKLLIDSNDVLVVKGLDSDLVINHGGNSVKVFIKKGVNVTTTSWKMVGKQVITIISSGDLKGIEINPDYSVKMVSGVNYVINPNYKVIVLSSLCKQITFLKCGNQVKVDIIDGSSEQKIFEEVIKIIN